jgi:hypothetical protein
VSAWATSDHRPSEPISRIQPKTRFELTMVREAWRTHQRLHQFSTTYALPSSQSRLEMRPIRERTSP